ncbi:MAG: glycosyltransferase family 39 protein [Planctomycetes bacterium]|nr:glycosyltransferase family 39 protein [Planctomycetota bacterium]
MNTDDRDPRFERVAWLLIAALCFFLYWTRDLTYFDEPRYVGVAKETASSESWVLPRIYGAPYTEKPPLWFWSVGLCGKLFGWNSFAYFLPNVLAHFLTALLLFDLGRRTSSRRAGVWAALVYAVCPLVLRNARSAQLDLMLVFGQALMAWGSILALQSKRLAFGIAAAAGFGVASMVKGHIALFGLLAPLTWCTAHRDWSFLRRPWWFLLTLLALVPIGAWIVALSRQIGWDEFVRLYIDRQVVERTAGGVAHYSPIPIGPEYLAALATMIPLVLFAPAAMRARETSNATRAFVFWAIAFFSIFALVPSKREIYLLPLAMPLALIVGERLAAFDLRRYVPTRFESAACMALAPLLVLAGLALPIYAYVRGALGLETVLAAAIAAFAGTFAVRAAFARRFDAPRLLFVMLASIAVFAEPAVGRIANARFGEKEFGLVVKERVPATEPVFVVNITKAQALRFFAERDLVFVDEPEHLAAAIAGKSVAFVVARGKDLKDLRKLGTNFEAVAVEPYETTAKAENLLIVTP